MRSQKRLGELLNIVTCIKFYSLTFPTICGSIQRKVGMREFGSHALLCFHPYLPAPLSTEAAVTPRVDKEMMYAFYRPLGNTLVPLVMIVILSSPPPFLAPPTQMRT